MSGHVHESLGSYVLGGLDPEEAASVRAHLARCPACAAEHASIAKLPALLDLAGAVDATAHPPLAPAVEERVLDRFARERPPAAARRWRRPRFGLRIAAPLAAAAAAVAIALVIAGQGGGSAPPRGHLYAVALRGTSVAPAASARAGLQSVPGGTVVHLWVRDLPPDPAAVYEVRCEAPGWSASAGTFRVDARGRAYVVLTTAARRGQYDVIKIMSRRRGADGRVRTAAVLDGRLS